MTYLEQLAQQVQQRFSQYIEHCDVANDEVTVEVSALHIGDLGLALRDEAPFEFDVLIDVCGVDYLQYGVTEWATEASANEGFSRGVEQGAAKERVLPWDKPRFAVVYHLLSVRNNQRIRLRAFLDDETLRIPSVAPIWNAASWFEREAFDMYGILFDGHPDLRRILTDYGFIGHPFRKDFPTRGHVEMRYDAQQKRVIYQPVSIEARTLVPKVYRADNRYGSEETDHG